MSAASNKPEDVVILNVDDHDAARYTKTRILQSAGYTVVEANCGQDAIRLAKEHRPTVALLDVKLPDMSGLDVCRRIKSDPSLESILVIQNSASFVGPEDKVRGLEGGADTYLTAPIEPAVLIATVGAMLRLARVEQELRESQRRLRALVESERSARALAERSDRLKDEFVTTLSHELRNPLMAIAGWASVLKSKEPDAATLAKGLEVIERGCRSQRKMIEDLLDMSRIMSGKLRLDVQDVDLDAIVDAVVTSLQIAADAKGISIERVGNRSSCRLFGDAARFQQIIWNLVSNAIKFTPRGGHVQIAMRSDENHVEVSVTDSGMGIETDFLPHVFERFRQADSSTTRRFGGLGIGLSIVKSLTELHGGVARVSSPGPGKGTTFVIDLPIGLPAHSSTLDGGAETAPLFERETGAAIRTPGLQSLAGVRLLVVDDDADALDLVSRVLCDAGASVTTATSAEEALNAVRESRPHAILSDIGMPDQDGLSFVRRLRAMESADDHLPAAALTAMARPEDEAKSLAAGFDIHIKKPVQPPELVEIVVGLLARKGTEGHRPVNEAGLGHP
jgi:signal transduction histidine kinase